MGQNHARIKHDVMLRRRSQS